MPNFTGERHLSDDARNIRPHPVWLTLLVARAAATIGLPPFRLFSRNTAVDQTTCGKIERSERRTITSLILEAVGKIMYSWELKVHEAKL